jgi:chromosome segregation ATPase
MTHLKGAVWTERLLLVLILASMGGTLNLVLAVHRRVNAISSAIVRERDAASEADRRTVSLEVAIRNSAAESQLWKRREMLVRQQVAKLNRRAEQIEQAVTTEDAERDVLARERDALKAATVKASQRSGYSVLPYKGPNGT